MAAVDKVLYNENLDTNVLARKLDDSLPDSQAPMVIPFYQVTADGLPVGAIRQLDWQYGFSGVVTLINCKAFTIVNTGNASVSVDIYNDTGDAVARTRSIPSGETISVQTDGLDVFPKMVLTATGSSVKYGVA